LAQEMRKSLEFQLLGLGEEKTNIWDFIQYINFLGTHTDKRTHGHISIHIYIYRCIQYIHTIYVYNICTHTYITLHCIALHCITLHYFTLHIYRHTYITSHYIQTHMQTDIHSGKQTDRYTHRPQTKVVTTLNQTKHIRMDSAQFEPAGGDICICIQSNLPPIYCSIKQS
jgi:hypothetical protein